MDFNIEKMALEDATEVAIIEKDNFSIPWSEQSLIDAVSNNDNIYVVAKNNGRVVGYIGSWSVFNEVNITNVCVVKEHRRQGIAEAMMSFLIQEGKQRGQDIFFLEVRVGNAPAIALYEKIGFERIGVRKNLYERPVEDGLVMSYTK